MAGPEGEIITISNDKFSKPYTSKKVGSPIQSLRFVKNGTALLISSLLPHAQLFFIDSEKLIDVPTPHIESVKSTDISRNVVASVGCDGFLHIVEVNGK